MFFKTPMKTGIQNLIIALMWLALPMFVQAQFTFTTNSGAITITHYTGTGGAVVIPAMTNGYPVTSIGNSVFFDCNSLTFRLFSRERAYRRWNRFHRLLGI